MQQEWFQSWFNTPYYHILYSPRSQDEAADFIEQLLAQLAPAPGSKFWDLCCGKGRHSIYLNQKGYMVTGTDLSDCNIASAREHETPTLDFYIHDMRTPFRIGYFDVVVNLFTSFGYFSCRKDNAKVFRNVYQALKPGGTFVLDFFNTHKVVNTLVAHDSRELQGIRFDVQRQYDGEYIRKTIDIDDHGQRLHFEEKVQALTLDDFKDLALGAGFRIDAVYGDYQLRPYDDLMSDRTILILKNCKSSMLLYNILGLFLPIFITGSLFLFIKIQGRYLRLLLAFSAAYLFALSMMHLLPDIYTEGGNARMVGLFILLGFFIQIIIEYFSTGIEHGHVHRHSKDCHSQLPVGIFVGLYLHSFLEGLPIYQGMQELPKDGMFSLSQQMVFGIALHNIPISIAFVGLLLEHHVAKTRIYVYLFLFALMAPMGCLVSAFCMEWACTISNIICKPYLPW